MVTCHSHINSVQLAGVASTGLSDFKTQANATLSCMFQCFHFFFFFYQLCFLPLSPSLPPRHPGRQAWDISPFCRFEK